MKLGSAFFYRVCLRERKTNLTRGVERGAIEKRQPAPWPFLAWYANTFHIERMRNPVLFSMWFYAMVSLCYHNLYNNRQRREEGDLLPQP